MIKHSQASLRMFATKLNVCVILVLIKVCSIISAVPDELTFKNVTVKASEDYNTPKITIRSVSAKSFKEISGSETLKVVHNIIGPLSILYEDSVADLPKLEVFVIKYSDLTEIRPGAFRNVTNLYTLAIEHTRLKRIEKGIFDNLNLTSLFLHENDISSISSEAFVNLTKLRSIILRNNHLSRWNKHWFVNTPKLNQLFFIYNQFEEIPNGAFENLKSTRWTRIELSHNKIVNVGEKLFGNSSEVDELNLSYNKIESFGEGVLEGVTRIDSLYLSGNKIQCLSGNWSKIFVARQTYLSANPLTCSSQLKEWEQTQADSNPDNFPIISL